MAFTPLNTNAIYTVNLLVTFMRFKIIDTTTASRSAGIAMVLHRDALDE